MRRTADPGARAILAGLALLALAAAAPAGLGGAPVPAASVAVWALAFAVAIVVTARAGLAPAQAARRMAWLLPFVMLLALPAAATAPPARRFALAMALAARAFASAALALAFATRLGPAGLVAAARRLRVPEPLPEMLEATLGSLAGATRQATQMLRAREARRTAHGAFAAWAAAPRETTRGFGRIVAALLLRALERGEALERARRARGGAS